MRQFKGLWIPREILEHPQLQPVDKILWGDIDSFTWGDHSFFKSNAAIAEEYQVSERTISRSVSRLKESGLITIATDGRRRTICPVRVDNLSRQPSQYGEADSPKSLHILNSVSKQSKKTVYSTPTQEECVLYFAQKGCPEDMAEQFFDYYTANGWVQGQSKKRIKDWQAAARNWIRNQSKFEKRKDGFKGTNFTVESANDFITNG